MTRWGGGGSRAPKPDTLGGVFRMKLGEYRWEHLMNGFPEVVHVHCITVHPKDKRIIFAGTQDGPYRSTDGGDHWERMRFSPRDLQVWSIAFHPHDPMDHVRRHVAGRRLSQQRWGREHGRRSRA